jgi:hypothetical protein
MKVETEQNHRRFIGLQFTILACDTDMNTKCKFEILEAISANWRPYISLRAGSVVSGYVTYYYGFPTSTGLFGTLVIVVAIIHANIHAFCRKRITYQSLESLSD